jgi:hypothetical protein
MIAAPYCTSYLFLFLFLVEWSHYFLFNFTQVRDRNTYYLNGVTGSTIPAIVTTKTDIAYIQFYMYASTKPPTATYNWQATYTASDGMLGFTAKNYDFKRGYSIVHLFLSRCRCNKYNTSADYNENNNNNHQINSFALQVFRCNRNYWNELLIRRNNSKCLQ